MKDENENLRARSDIRVDGVFDIETHDWTEFVVGGLLHGSGEYQLFDWRREELLVESMLRIEPAPGERWAWIWAHNGGRFDTLWAADWLSEMGLKFEMINSGSGIASLRCGHTQFLDSYKLTKQSLKDLTASLGVSKGELGLPCICGEACGGYCSISRRMPRPQFRAMCDYLEKDCRSLAGALGELRQFASEKDLDLGITVGSSAWKTARRWLELPKNELIERASDFRFARTGYFGGRVYKGKDFSPGHPIFPRCSVIDVNSMYPAALNSAEVPAGQCRGQVYGKAARAAYVHRQPGVYAATVHVPEMLIPPLPIRDRHETICYPWGEFQGTWPLPELEYAETLGCTVEPYRAVTWTHAEKIFAPWARKLFDIRANCPGGKNSPLGNFVKFLLNSLTGKLGARGTVERDFHDRELEVERRICKCTGLCRQVVDRRARWKCGCRGRCTRWCEGECGCVLPVDDRGDDSHLYWRSKHFRIQECARPQVAAYLTGVSRSLKWHAQATSVGGGADVVYGDTDSLVTELGRTQNIGKDLGQWALECRYSNFVAVAPKTYQYERLEFGEGAKIKIGSKGVKDPKLDQIIAEGGKRTAAIDTGQRIMGVRTGMKKGKLFQRASSARTLSWQYGDRIPFADGTTRPPHASEIEFEEG